MRTLPRNTVLVGDARERLAELPEASVDCVITSPPYYQLRNYGVAGQLGLEATVSGWVEAMRAVVAELARVLKPAGSLWLNLADSYSRHPRYGAPPKAMLLAPERLLLSLAGDGWRVRNKVIWAKTNPMPHSVADRLSTTYEVVYFLVRSPRYYFDLDAIRRPHCSTAARSGRPAIGRRPHWAGPLAGSQDGLRRARAAGQPGHVLGKNPGDVWHLATAGYRGAHFATFPPALVERPLLAGCPERTCAACGQAWRRPRLWQDGRTAAELQPVCNCRAGWRPGLVLDPFFGSGTVAAVARAHRRDWLGIELNPAYAALAEQRLGIAAGQLAA